MSGCLFFSLEEDTDGCVFQLCCDFGMEGKYGRGHSVSPQPPQLDAQKKNNYALKAFWL